ncbi:upstream stimulatory factor 2 [Hoplias malabaricus]|uniref:upstream stimulatory factor 2 n=1 Tax=Hoplias malabaricus TaxID=27720 RepID=UPI003462EF26
MEDPQRGFSTSQRLDKQEEEGVQVLEGGQAAALGFTDHNIHYQFHPDSRTTQSVIQSPFSNGGGPGAEVMGGEPRYAYLPAAAVSDAAAMSVSLQPSEHTHTGGQFYVMMATPDVLQSGAPGSIAPCTPPYAAVKMEGLRTPRDERRRAQHNEVERRRRDKINNWIVTLSKLIPDCNVDSNKTGASKGGILSKACDYIQELRQHNHRLQESLKEVKRVQMDNEILRQQVDKLKNENALLKAHLQCGGSGNVSRDPSL